MDQPASLEDMELFGLRAESGHLYALRNCQCATQYIVDCSGQKVEMRRVKGECAFCHGSISFRTDFSDVSFHFQP